MLFKNKIFLFLLIVYFPAFLVSIFASFVKSIMYLFDNKEVFKLLKNGATM